MITIMKFKNAKNIILLLTICLISLNSRKDIKQFYIRKNLAKTNKFTNQIHSVNSANNLKIIFKILSLTSKEKKKIINILINYPSIYQYCQQSEKLIAQKYIERFTYKYQKNNKHKFKIQNHKTQKKNDILGFALPIIILYAVYKILRVKNRFSGYKKFIK